MEYLREYLSTVPDPLLIFAAGAMTQSCILLPFLLLGKGSKKTTATAPKPKPLALSGDEKKDFLLVFNALTEEILESVDQYNLPPRTREYVKRMAVYNVPKGKLTRGLTVISALKELKYGGKPLPPAEYQRAATLGWCVEWLQAMFLVMDDIMDESETRRGQVCAAGPSACSLFRAAVRGTSPTRRLAFRRCGTPAGCGGRATCVPVAHRAAFIMMAHARGVCVCRSAGTCSPTSR
jgi:hypothetical protein